MGRALSLLRAAGEALSLWPLAGGHRAAIGPHRRAIASSSATSRSASEEYRATGKFTIPIELGLSASRRTSIASLWRNGWPAKASILALLNWYIELLPAATITAPLARHTSAWAGIQYFASREPEEKGPLTWPEGNGWIARRLLERIGSFIQTGRMVHKIAQHGNRIGVFAGDTEYQTDFVIFAAPTFLAPYLIEGMRPLQDFEYSPWLTANLTLERLPDSYGSDPTWDSVFMESPTLGYVDATHQTLRSHIDRTVWTFYWALAEGSASDKPPAY